MLVEILLDKFGSFMLLEACGESAIKFDFSEAFVSNPGILNIRLTDLNEIFNDTNTIKARPPPKQRCNTSPVGLFAFSLTVALDNLDLLGKLVGGSVDASFLLTFGPYAFFVSGLLQLLVGLNEISRNNVYGATAFMAFGCFWLANGTKLILLTYFPDEISDEQLLGTSEVADFVREFYIFMFACALFKQTLVMNKLTTGLISVLILYLVSASVAGWSEAFSWIKMILGWVLSLYAFFLFFAELTNEVYQREVINLFPWNEDSPGEAFGAAGRANTLQHKAIDLRTAGRSDVLAPNQQRGSTFHVRAVRPMDRNGQQ